MGLILGFPFFNNDTFALTIYMPYRNHSNDTVEYTAINTFATRSAETGISDGAEKIALFAFLNKCNPDWANIRIDSPAPVPGITGEMFIPIKNVNSVSFDVTQGSQFVDRWWGSNTIGKYGTWSFYQANRLTMPLTYINALKCTMVDNYAEHDGIYVNMQPGVVGTLRYRQSNGEDNLISLVPPVTWSSPNAFNILAPGYSQALQVNAGNLGTWQEVLP